MAKHPTLDINKPLGLGLNRESASMLLRGLENLPAEERTSVIFDKLKHDLNTIVVIWNRRIKNEKLIQEQRRIIHAKNKENQPKSNRRAVPRQNPEHAEEQPPPSS